MAEHRSTGAFSASKGSSTQQDVSQRAVPTRRISFSDGLGEMPRHFSGDGDLVTSHLFAVLSAAFPEGEDGFVRSVRSYRDRLTEPELRRQVAGFIGQEAMHGREHRAMNDRLAELGYPTHRVERMIKRLVRTRERYASAEMSLANTAAMEHFTATLAEVMLGDPEARRIAGDSVAAEMLLWHALEEAEHKAVAFDVYRAIGGSERTRRLAMNIACVAFLGGTTMMITSSLLRDPATYRRGNLRRSLKRLRRAPFMQRSVWRRLRDYNRAEFHPDDHDTTELVRHWRAELFGEFGSMNDRLVGSAAA